MADTLQYHLERTMQQYLLPYTSRRLSWNLITSITWFDKAKLKTPIVPHTRKPPHTYATLPCENLIENLMLKVQRVPAAMNWRAALIDVKQDLRILLQEYRVEQQNHVQALDDSYMLGYSDGSKPYAASCVYFQSINDNK